VAPFGGDLDQGKKHEGALVEAGMGDAEMGAGEHPVARSQDVDVHGAGRVGAGRVADRPNAPHLPLDATDEREHLLRRNGPVEPYGQVQEVGLVGAPDRRRTVERRATARAELPLQPANRLAQLRGRVAQVRAESQEERRAGVSR
jgi:hypothetical protein